MTCCFVYFREKDYFGVTLQITDGERRTSLKLLAVNKNQMKYDVLVPFLKYAFTPFASKIKLMSYVEPNIV